MEPTKTGIRVVLRTRPTASFAQDRIFVNPEKSVGPRDAHAAQTITVNMLDAKTSSDVVCNKRESQGFQFHSVLHNASQESVYSEVAPIVSSVLEGINGTIMAYGQTGSGKTFSMVGRPGDFTQRGVIPRAIDQIFNEIDARSDMEFRVSVSYMEIYNEKIFDLLSDQSESLTDFQIVEEPGSRGSMMVKGLTRRMASSEEEVLQELFRGDSRRTTAEHLLNKNSNRSHCIFTLYLEQQSRLGDTSKIICSKLHLVDLAGSERLKKTTADLRSELLPETTLKESMYINQSLTFLEQCVVALTQGNRSHIPFRQSKLTNILQDSLGGNCRTILIACMWGEAKHLEETVSTLRFASRMMRVKTVSSANVMYDPTQLIKKYESQIKELKSELILSAAFNGRSTEIYNEMTESQKSELGRKVRQYIEANENEEDGILEFESLHQVKEIFRQFKSLLRQVQRETAERIKADLMGQALSPKDAQGAGESSSARAAEAKGVGELVNTGAFAAGFAPDDAAPSGALESLLSSPSKYDSHSERERTSSPKMGHRSPTPGHFGSSTAAYLPSDQNAAFERYKSSEGRQFHRSLLAEKERLTDKNYEIKSLISDINGSKDQIDDLRQQVEEKRKRNSEVLDGQRVIDEEEYSLVMKLGDEKKRYQELSERLQALKKGRSSLEESVSAARRALVEGFEKWNLGVSSEAVGGVGSEESKTEMDYGEQWERMQMENDLATDPKSVAFYTISPSPRPPPPATLLHCWNAQRKIHRTVKAASRRR